LGQAPRRTSNVALLSSSQAICPDIHDLQVIEPPLLPGFILQLPLGLEPRQRGG
jgi:hypothetical protein